MLESRVRECLLLGTLPGTAAWATLLCLLPVLTPALSAEHPPVRPRQQARLLQQRSCPEVRQSVSDLPSTPVTEEAGRARCGSEGWSHNGLVRFVLTPSLGWIHFFSSCQAFWSKKCLVSNAGLSGHTSLTNVEDYLGRRVWLLLPRIQSYKCLLQLFFHPLLWFASLVCGRYWNSGDWLCGKVSFNIAWVTGNEGWKSWRKAMNKVNKIWVVEGSSSGRVGFCYSHVTATSACEIVYQLDWGRGSFLALFRKSQTADLEDLDMTWLHTGWNGVSLGVP